MPQLFLVRFRVEINIPVVEPQVVPLAKPLVWASGAIGSLGYVDASLIEKCPHVVNIPAPVLEREHLSYLRPHWCTIAARAHPFALILVVAYSDVAHHRCKFRVELPGRAQFQ